MSDDYTPTTAEVRRVYAESDSLTRGHMMERAVAFDRWLADLIAEKERVAAEKAWDQGAAHVYDEGGKCSFARDGDPCPYNPYRRGQASE